MDNLKLNQIYLWKKRSDYNYPWQRQFLNLDFLKYEQKRINDVEKWFREFQRAPIGKRLEEVYYYAIPLPKIESNLKVGIALKGDYNYIGLSALKNCVNFELLMLMPKEIKIPKDYSLIRILGSFKDFINYAGSNYGQYIIVAERIEEQDPALVYLDVPHENRGISKFIKENLINDEFWADSFQPSISGSPYKLNEGGGISFSAFFNNNPFSEELFNTLKLMQPPEFSNICSQFPKKLLMGKEVSTPLGTFRVAEADIFGSNYYSAFYSNSYDYLNYELSKKNTFPGEYSIVGSLSAKGDEASELLRDYISKFLRTNITQPYATDELKEWDINLFDTQKNITEDLWLQIAEQKQIKPITSIGEINLRKKLSEEWKVILERFNLKKGIEEEANIYVNKSYSNIIKVAQSMARDRFLGEVTDSLILKSFNLFVKNAQLLTDNKQIQHTINVVIPLRHEDSRFNAVRAELRLNLIDIKELFSRVEKFFKDIYELQKYIDKLNREGYVYEPKQGYYRWV